MKKLLLLLLCSCSVNEQYIAADRAMHDVVTPKLVGYLMADSSLTQGEKDRWLRLLEAWNIRLIKWEEAQK
jgi:putative N-acetylmannosamine-6-phosphate epimerase